MNFQQLHEKFASIFERTAPSRLFFAPGRINLIGEHTDYNGGHVFPAAISYGTYAVAAKRTDNKWRFFSLNFPETGMIEGNINELAYNEKHHWANYPKGMMKYIHNNGEAITSGMDVLFYGNIPNNAGLSSSASIEMVTGVLLESLFHVKLDQIDMIKIGQKVENNYIGVNSGIMDQFAVYMGKKDHAIHLNTQTLHYTYAPINMPNHAIMIINTNKQRALAESKYNERRTECDQALKTLQQKLNIQHLGDITPTTFETHKHLIKNKTNRNRAKHVIYENERTLQALTKLNNNDLAGFGILMNKSHLSLQHDYEVTGIELDTIVEATWNQPGVLGARMTGAGFGGCAIAIVEKDKIDSIKEKVHRIYHETCHNEATFYIARISDGAKELTNKED